MSGLCSPQHMLLGTSACCSPTSHLHALVFTFSSNEHASFLCCLQAPVRNVAVPVYLPGLCGGRRTTCKHQSFCLLPRSFWGLSSGGQAWWQSPFPAESSHWPRSVLFLFFFKIFVHWGLLWLWGNLVRTTSGVRQADRKLLD